MEKKTRKISTRMYGQRAFDILDSVHGQLSDGLWENTPGYDKYWLNFDVVRDPDDRVCIEVNAENSTKWGNAQVENPFKAMSDKDFLAWLARKLKKVITVEAKDNMWADGWWCRTCSVESRYLDRELDVTVADVYEVYDEILGRRSRTAGNGERIFGHAADAETTARRERAAAAKKAAGDAYNRALEAANKAYEKEAEKAKNALLAAEKARDAAKSAAYDAWRKACAEAAKLGA